MDNRWLKLMDDCVQTSSWSNTFTLDALTGRYMIGGSSPYIDVRAKEEFNNGHLENAVNVPYMFYTKKGWVKNPKFVEMVLAVCGKGDHPILGCQDGVRSKAACNDLRLAGFDYVFDMAGGHSALVANGSYAITEPEPMKPKLSFVARIRKLFLCNYR